MHTYITYINQQKLHTSIHIHMTELISQRLVIFRSPHSLLSLSLLLSPLLLSSVLIFSSFSTSTLLSSSLPISPPRYSLLSLSLSLHYISPPPNTITSHTRKKTKRPEHLIPPKSIVIVAVAIELSINHQHVGAIYVKQSTRHHLFSLFPGVLASSE